MNIYSKIVIIHNCLQEYIKVTGKWHFFRQVVWIMMVMAMIYGLVYFCIESNKVQIHEYKISIDTSDPFILDSLSIRLEYPMLEENKICMTIEQTLNGEKILTNPPRDYFLRNGFEVDNVLTRMRVSTSVLIDEKPLKRNKKKKVEKDHEYILMQEGHLYNDSVIYVEYFFLDGVEQILLDKPKISNIFTYNYRPNFLSLHNLQRRYVAIQLDTPLDREKIRFEMNFKMPVNVHSISIKPDKQRFKSMIFDQKDNLTSLCSNGFTAIVETLPYEGIQTARNFLISAVSPMVVTYLWYLLVRMVRSIKKVHDETML